MQIKENIYGITLALGICTVIFHILGTSSEYQIFSLAQAVSGTIFILFIPGYFCTRSFFEDTEIDVFERIALSIALSISIVPLLSFYGNLLGIPINFYSIMAIVVSTILLSIGYQSFFQTNYKPGVVQK